jgi:hypothetical protein
LNLSEVYREVSIMAAAPKKYPGPYTIEYELATTVGARTLTHQVELNCFAVGSPLPGSDLSTVLLSRAGGGTLSAATAITDFWTQYKIGCATVTSAITATLWKYEPLSYERSFIGAYSGSLGAGTGGATAQEGHQTQITLRTAGGSYMRVNWLEDIQNRKDTTALVPLAAGNAQQRVAALLLSINGWASGRDKSWPVAPMRISYTQNEAIDRERFRG